MDRRTFIGLFGLLGCKDELDDMRNNILFFNKKTPSDQNPPPDPGPPDPPPSEGDYLTNLYDWWVPNRGIVISFDNTYMDRWNGYINNTQVTASGSPALRTDGIVGVDGSGDSFSISTTTYPLTGAATFAFRVRKSATIANTNPLFDSNTNAPRVQLFLQISSVNTNIGFNYNGVSFNTGVSFTYDNNWHNVVFVLNVTTAKVYLDGVQIGDTFNLTGGGIAMNAGQNATLLKSISSPNISGNYECHGVRIYTEALSETNIGILESNSFSDGPIVDLTNTWIIFVGGQSNVGPGYGYNLISNYPTELKNGFDDVYLFDYINQPRGYIPIAGNTSTFISPGGSYPIKPGSFLKVAYDLRQLYPNDNIRIYILHKPATNLVVEWAPGTTLRTRFFERAQNALKHLEVEQRNIVNKSLLWIQGESDAVELAVPPAASDDEGAINYYYNLGDPANNNSFMKEVVDKLDPDYIVVSALSVNVAASMPYKALVRQAQEDFVDLNPTRNKLIDTDNGTVYSFEGGDVHYTVNGLIAIGEEFVNIITV